MLQKQRQDTPTNPTSARQLGDDEALKKFADKANDLSARIQSQAKEKWMCTCGAGPYDSPSQVCKPVRA